MIFWISLGGESKAVWNFSENSSVLVARPVSKLEYWMTGSIVPLAMFHKNNWQGICESEAGSANHSGWLLMTLLSRWRKRIVYWKIYSTASSRVEEQQTRLSPPQQDQTAGTMWKDGGTLEMKATSGNKVQVPANIMISEVSLKYQTYRNFCRKDCYQLNWRGRWVSRPSSWGVCGGWK